MSRFPDTVRPQAPAAGGYERPVVTGGPRWRPQSRNLTRYNLMKWDLTYRLLSWTDAKTLYDFWESVGGAGGTFSFADFNGIGPIGGSDPGVPWTGLYVAKGDGVTVNWNLPTFGLQSSPAPVVKANGVTKTSEIYTTSTNPAFDYHIKKAAGADGEDIISAQVAPALGVIVTIDATCRRFARYAKFVGDVFPFSLDDPTAVQAGTLSLIEVMG